MKLTLKGNVVTNNAVENYDVDRICCIKEYDIKESGIVGGPIRVQYTVPCKYPNQVASTFELRNINSLAASIPQ
jgi:hypothetical protein